MPAVLTRPAVSVVTVTGALDGLTTPRVRDEVAEALAERPARLVVDLRGCGFVDAGALAMLVDAHRRLVQQGGLLTLRGCSPRVVRLLSLTGLRGVFDLTD